jgi:hypothetical protein
VDFRTAARWENAEIVEENLFYDVRRADASDWDWQVIEDALGRSRRYGPVVISRSTSKPLARAVAMAAPNCSGESRGVRARIQRYVRSGDPTTAHE